MSPSPAPDARRVSVIVPVKQLGEAKSRTHLPASERAELALELMARTVAAAAATASVARVIVVAGDATVAESAHSLGALVLLEPTAAGLNGAVMAGRECAQRDHPEDDIVIMVGDLANLAAADLAAVIAEFRRCGTALMVPDHLGIGTTMLVHDRAAAPPVLFGANSAARHRDAGYVSFTHAPDGARHDVDAPEDVEALITEDTRL